MSQGERMTEVKLDDDTRERIARDLDLKGTEGVPETIRFVSEKGNTDVEAHMMSTEARLRIPD